MTTAHPFTIAAWEPRQPPLTPSCDARATVLRNGIACALLYRLTSIPQPYQLEDQPPDPGPQPPFICYQLHNLAGKPLATSLHIEPLLTTLAESLTVG